MGFFSGITKAIGGIFGGGSSSSSQTNKQNTTVKNNVEVNIPLDELAQTLEEISVKDIFVKTQLAKKEYSERDQDQLLKLADLELRAKEQEQEENYKKVMILLSSLGLMMAAIGHFKKKGKS